MRRQLNEFSRAELLAFAGAEGIRGRHRLRKAELVGALVEVYRGLAESPAALRSLKRKDLLRLARALSIERRDRLAKMELVEALLAGWTAWRASEPAQETVEAARYGLVSSPGGREPHETLPSGYGKTRLALMTIDPYRVHIYWEVAPADYRAARDGLGGDGKAAEMVLRIYDVTGTVSDGTNASHSFDVEVGAATNWYLNLWSSEKSLQAEVGLRSPRGRFVPLARSNAVDTPRAAPSDRWEERWMEGRWGGRPFGGTAPARASSSAAAAGPPGLNPTTPPRPASVALAPLRRREGRGGTTAGGLEPAPGAQEMAPLRAPRGSADPAVAATEPAVSSEERHTPHPSPEPAGWGTRTNLEVPGRAGGAPEGPPETPGLMAWRSLEGTWVTSPAGPAPDSQER